MADQTNDSSIHPDDLQPRSNLVQASSAASNATGTPAQAGVRDVMKRQANCADVWPYV